MKIRKKQLYNDQKNSDPSRSLFETVDKFEESEFAYSFLKIFQLIEEIRFLSADSQPSRIKAIGSGVSAR